jgi:aminopeptidase N
MSITCISETKELKNYRNSNLFFIRFLSLALDRDIKITTHPIKTVINDTNEATSAFDEISYEKGACMLK